MEDNSYNFVFGDTNRVVDKNKVFIINTNYEKERIKVVEKLNSFNLNGFGIEIGVNKGEFSKLLLTHWNCKKLYLVDPWEKYSEYNEIFHEHQNNFNETIKNLENFNEEKYEIVKDYSSNASKLFENDYFDFIYIDANHTYEAVKEDLELWYPKLKKNGIIMGDDYINLESGKNIGNFGVRKAVDEFCLKEKKIPCLQYTADWYINGNYNVDALYGGKIYDQVFENILYKARNWLIMK